MIAEKIENLGYEEIPDGLVDLSKFSDEDEIAERVSNYYNTNYLDLANTKVRYLINSKRNKLDVMQDSLRKGTSIQSVLVTKNNITQALEYIEALHFNAQGYITLAQKIEGSWCQYHFTVADLKKCLNNAVEGADMGISTLGIDLAKDTYISLNTYYVPKREETCIKQIRALYAEFDNHDKNKNFVMTDDIYNSCKYFLQADYFGSKVPEPSLMVRTGRGIQLIWTLENLPKKGNFLWGKVAEAIRKELKDFNLYGLKVDETASSLSQVFRLPGTTHTITGMTTYLDGETSTKNIYRLDELIEGYFPELKEEELKRKAKKAKKIELEKEKEKRKNRKARNLVKKAPVKTKATVKNYYTLNSARIFDFEKLFEIRHGNFKENRNNFMYIYTYYLYLVHTKNDMYVIDKVSRLNNRFAPACGGPLKDKEIKNILKYYKKKAIKLINAENKKADDITAYRFKNTTLINLFNITVDEQKQLKTIISKDEKADRKRKSALIYYNEQRKIKIESGKLVTKKQKIEEEKNKIIKLIEQGYTHKQIADMMGISTKTVQRRLKE